MADTPKLDEERKGAVRPESQHASVRDLADRVARPYGFSQRVRPADDPQYNPYEEDEVDEDKLDQDDDLDDSNRMLEDSISSSGSDNADSDETVMVPETLVLNSGTDDADDCVLVVPGTIKNLEANTSGGSHINQCPGQLLHDRYHRFVSGLCRGTGTGRFEDDVLGAFAHILPAICGLDMSQSYREDQDLDIFAHGMIIYCWLLVCKKRLQGAPPRKEESLHIRFGAYFLAAGEMVKTELGDFNLKYLAVAVDYWDKSSFDGSQWSIWAQQPWFADMEMEDMEKPCHRNNEADGYLDTLSKHGIEGLTELLIRKEVQEQKSSLIVLPTDQSFRWVICMMASIDPELLKAIIEGQVARKAEILTTSLSNRLDRILNQTDHPPSIYQNALCDHEGISPTPVQWYEICDLMQLYVDDNSIEGDDLAAKVDQIIHPSPHWPVPARKERGLRRYTEWSSFLREESYEHASGRRMIIYDFAEQLKKRLDKEIAYGRGHVPLVAPVVEVGFSDRVIKRLRQHRQHKSSNYIMNLAQALFEYQFPRFFCLKQHIIFECFRHDQPWFSEILLTRLSQAYTTNGSGFSHYGAGFSNGGSWRRRPFTDWHRFLKRACSDGGFQSRLGEIHERTAARRAEEERREEEERRLLQCVQALRGVVNAATQVVIAQRRS